MTTSTKTVDIRQILNLARFDQIADVAKTMELGNMLSVVKVVVAGLTASATIDITDADTKTAATVTGMDLDTGENLPAIGRVVTLRVVTSTGAGVLAAGPAVVTDVDGTATAIGALAFHVATLSDDGTTLVFADTVTDFVITYIPRATVAANTAFPLGAPGGDN